MQQSSLVVVLVAALGLGGCGLVEAHDGPTREDFERARTESRGPEQSESAATAEDFHEAEDIGAVEPAPSLLTDDFDDATRVLTPVPYNADAPR